MDTQIYTGTWTDWSRGRVLGATLTLSSRDGKALISFLAFFVTIVGTRAWRIVSFAAHQILAKESPHDGLHYQRQHILRNIGTPAESAWLFLQQSWYWRKPMPKAWLRTLPWALGAALYMGLFAAASILSSSISDDASQYRLLKSGDCGLFEPKDSESMHVVQRAFENQQAATYNRQCYDDDTPSDACDYLPVRSIQWTNGSMVCPFNSTICLPEVRPFHMETKVLDSHLHFGINEPPHNRVGYRRETLCTPLVTIDSETNMSFVDVTTATKNGQTYDAKLSYRYGQRFGQLGLMSNYTHVYNTDNFEGNMAYSVWALRHNPITRSWVPIPALMPNRSADTTIMFIVHNSMKHLDQNDDPIFGAHDVWREQEGQTTPEFLPDRVVSPIACIDRHQLCNLDPKKYKCTRSQSSRTVGNSTELASLNLNSAQMAAAIRISFLSRFQSFYDLINTRANNFLRAQDRVIQLTQYSLPDDQWKIEMAALFSDSLSLMQHQLVRYPTGPPRPGNITVLKLWIPDDTIERSIDDPGLTQADIDLNTAFETMCHTQKVRITDGTLNFSVLGLGLLLGIGLLLIILSYVVQPVVASRQRKTPTGAMKAGHWDRDDALQVLRRLLGAMGAGDWEGVMSEFPRTKTACTFEYDPVAREQETTTARTTPTHDSGEETSQVALASPGIRRKPVAVVSEAGV